MLITTDFPIDLTYLQNFVLPTTDKYQKYEISNIPTYFIVQHSDRL